MIDILAVNILTCAGQLAQKQAASGEPQQGSRRRHVLVWLGISLLCLGSAMLLWLSVLQRVPVGVAYPMLSLNFILVTLAARWFWHETITTRQWLGIALIVLGVIFVGRGA
ncbi:4-amino-4-deoxy-L-arabinose-phosphoundecaprenol flippase subunit ArnE [Pleomorphomonas oryzae]|uniref:4-amino-4-deoxy-L-arabinose-phosphoundecaprenol flippase subunit ArnE n=1 Tax=Pleomorphomonas oryzae TaxID=261934 RepID=UPI00041A764C|nr:4-amino-4-deoxy-L-arabinose-phosphoundecaprenol flippase subunit ArnE [Pleomorphomonas oryzae]